MHLAPTIIWLAACAEMLLGTVSSAIVPQPDDVASEIQSILSSHMFASSQTSHTNHALTWFPSSQSPALSTSIALVTTVGGGTTAVIPTHIVITLKPSKNFTSTPLGPAGDILQNGAIITVTSLLGLPTVSPVLTLTSTVQEVVTVTANFPSVSMSFPDPQSQIQGSTESGPLISFVPVASTVSTIPSAPTSKPQLVPSAGGYKYLGCWAGDLVTRALGDAFFPNDENTIERCTASCYPFKYAGTEYGRECWCGDELKDASKVNGSDFCNMPCAGDSREYCGGINALNVYVREDADSSSLVSVSGSPGRSITSQAVVSTSSSSSAASTGLAIVIASISSQTTPSSPTGKTSTTFVTPTQSRVENGTTTTTSLTTPIVTDLPTSSSIVLPSSTTTAQTSTTLILPISLKISTTTTPSSSTILPILPSPPIGPTTPSPLVSSTKDRPTPTSTIKVQPATSKKVITIHESTTTTATNTVTWKTSHAALPVSTIYSSVASAKTTTSSAGESETNTIPTASAFLMIAPPPPPLTGTLPGLSGGIWSTWPPPGDLAVTEAIPQVAPPRSETAISSPTSRPKPKGTLYTYGASAALTNSIVTVTSMLTDTTLSSKPGATAAAAPGAGADQKTGVLLAGLLALIFVV